MLAIIIIIITLSHWIKASALILNIVLSLLAGSRIWDLIQRPWLQHTLVPSASTGTLGKWTRTSMMSDDPNPQE